MPNRNRPLCTFTLDPDLLQGLELLRERDGASASESVRRALRVWLERKGVPSSGHGGIHDPDNRANGVAVTPEEERAMDEADLQLIHRALRRLKVRPRDQTRRERLLTQLEAEIDELLRG